MSIVPSREDRPRTRATATRAPFRGAKRIHAAIATAPDPAAALADGLRTAFGADLAVVRVRDRHGVRDVISRASPSVAPPFERVPEDFATAVGLAGGGGPWTGIAAHLTGDAVALHGAPVLTIPLDTPGTPDLGAVALLRRPGGEPFAEREMADARAIATEVGLALENRLLRDHDARMRGLLDAVVRESSNGVLVVDAGGLLAVANRAAVGLTGVALASRIGRPFADVVADALKWRFVNPEDFARALRDALLTADELRWEERTVGGRAVQMVCAPLHGPSGEDLGHVITLSEITAARRELRRIERRERDREQQIALREQRVREESAMTRAAHQLSSALTPDDVHRRLMNEASRAVGANRVAILSLRGTQAAVIASRGFTRTTLAALVRSPLRRRTALRRTFATRRVFVCNETENEPDDPGIRAMRAEGMRSLMHVPITLGGRIYGALTVSSTEPRTYTERDVKVLSELAGHAAGALRNAEQFARNRNLADLLQESLLAKELPSVPGLSLAALYRAAAGEMVGGDFYDVWTTTDGRVAVMVGDVSGKGPEAAATTAMVRHMIDGLSAAETEPSDLIEHLNSLLVTRLAPEALVTVVLALYDPAGGTLTWCNAGHPPPLLLCHDHTLRRLGLPEPPCGAFADSRYTEHTTRFEVGDTLLLYTDGLIEARRRGEEFGEARLAAEATELAEESPSGLARGLYAAVRQWAEDGRLNDDVAIAVVRRSN